ncbi:hypothetical protein GW17_00027594, partial [Ensete ventricosum]
RKDQNCFCFLKFSLPLLFRKGVAAEDATLEVRFVHLDEPEGRRSFSPNNQKVRQCLLNFYVNAHIYWCIFSSRGAEPKQLAFSTALGISLGLFPICGMEKESLAALTGFNNDS